MVYWVKLVIKSSNIYLFIGNEDGIKFIVF